MGKFVFDMGNWAQDDIKRFTRANEGTIKAMKVATFEAAKVIADRVADKARTIKPYGLEKGLRVARHQVDSDSVNTLIWFDGYDENGEPYAKRANAINSGRSLPDGGKAMAYPFFREAEKEAKQEAIKAAEEAFTQHMNELLEVK